MHFKIVSGKTARDKPRVMVEKRGWFWRLRGSCGPRARSQDGDGRRVRYDRLARGAIVPDVGQSV